MKPIFAATLVLLTLTGCGFSKSKQAAAPTAVSRWASTPLPVPPPVPDPAPTAQAITGASNDVAAAQASVKQVLAVAEQTPAAAAAVTPLSSADAHLTAALTKLNEATTRINELTEKLAVSEDAHTHAEAVLRGDIENLKAAAVKDGATSTKQIQALESENDELKNESMRAAKMRLMWMGVLCLLGAAGSVVASMYLGFLAGPKLAGVMGMAGVFLITLSQLLQKIAFYGEVACLVGVVGLVAWLLYHAFHHEPIQPEGKPNAT